MAQYLNILFLAICCISNGIVDCEKVLVCEGNSHSIDCGYNKYISIDSAKWGIEDHDTCTYHILDCTKMDDKTSTIELLCQGKQACFITASEYKFGSPCPVLGDVWVHYLRINYHCEVKNECESNPCLKGTCFDGIEVYTCICYPGYYGKNCENEFNECESNPCVHGKCSDNINSYQCSCDPGYIGVNCQHDIDECRRNPCVYGNCTNQINSYKCDCEPGYTGFNCQHDIDECQSNPCVHGNCINNVSHYKCLCYPGFRGINCENETDECLSSPCVHGTCVSSVNKYECRCSRDAFGVNCEFSIFDYTVPITIIFGILLFLMSLLVFYVTSKVKKIDDDLEDNKMERIMRHYNIPHPDQAKLIFDTKKIKTINIIDNSGRFSNKIYFSLNQMLKLKISEYNLNTGKNK